MKNCMIAALNLPHFPHQERDSALVIQITHKGDATLPLQHRFIIDSISRHNRGENELTSMELVRRLDSEDTKKTIEFGKKEMGRDYYGIVMDKFGSELWFEPEPPRTEPEVQFSVLKNG